MANDIQGQGTVPMAFTPTYNEEWEFPPGERTATIYLHGLLCLCFNHGSECTVAVNHISSSHTPKLEVWLRGSSTPLYTLSPGSSHKIEIKAVDKDGKPKNGVAVYVPEVKPASEPPPTSPPTDRFSFRHCLDLESDLFHNKKLNKDLAVLGPTFSIQKGFFSSSKTTVSEFELKRTLGMSTAVQSIGNIAAALAADLFLEDGDKILIAEGTSVLKELSCTSGAQYDIALTNDCTGSACTFNPSSSVPEERSDFCLYYRVITLADGDPPFQLWLKPSSGGVAIERPREYLPDRYFSDPAPCAPIIFGRTSTLP